MLDAVQRILIRSMLADDAPAALRAELDRATDLSPAEREQLAHVSPDGLRLSALLVRKLRFERLTRGDADLDRLFDTDPAAFMRLFRAYTAGLPPDAYFPDEEARAFRRWRDAESR